MKAKLTLFLPVLALLADVASAQESDLLVTKDGPVIFTLHPMDQRMLT